MRLWLRMGRAFRLREEPPRHVSPSAVFADGRLGDVQGHPHGAREALSGRRTATTPAFSGLGCGHPPRSPPMKRAALVALLPLLAACATEGDWTTQHNSPDAAIQ